MELGSYILEIKNGKKLSIIFPEDGEENGFDAVESALFAINVAKNTGLKTPRVYLVPGVPVLIMSDSDIPKNVNEAIIGTACMLAGIDIEQKDYDYSDYSLIECKGFSEEKETAVINKKDN